MVNQDLDLDGSGSLEIDEFSRLACSLGRRLSERECKAAMAEMDQDGSGSIEFDEFASWVRPGPEFLWPGAEKLCLIASP